ncbi:hypothetical protein SteCoe_37114 [Stentor coeruleus]|uniref:Uncharacterized protein n=1 Tax=Stentor coeruleus TaxID=5963 RepID=A0A1R2AP18_9CILI|nr:hypothetical protein SteCoe_37114 [Stentor coeruleus]
MDKSSENLQNTFFRKKNTEKFIKIKKKSKSFLINEPPGVSNKFKILKVSKKIEPTPLKTRASVNKENAHKKDASSIINTSSSKPKIQNQNTLKKKFIKLKVCKKHYSRGQSLCNTGRKSQQKEPQETLKPQSSFNNLKVGEISNKLTPRSTHPSPQHSHRTPDSIRLSQNQNMPVLTEKKTKIPEVGYYCKRLSIFDKSKYLYTDGDISSIYGNKSTLGEDNYENPFDVACDDLILQKREGISSITKTLKLDSLSPSSKTSEPKLSPQKFKKITELQKSPETKSAKLLSQNPNNTEQFDSFKTFEQIEAFESFEVLEDFEPFKRSKSPNTIISSDSSMKAINLFAKTTADFYNPNDENPIITPPRSQIDNIYNPESFTSPTRVIKIYNSPDGNVVMKTPESICKKNSQCGPGAPRKTLADYDSPGSFVFSLSSNSSEERIGESCGKIPNHLLDEGGFLTKKPLFSGYRDEESQTDLFDIVTDEKVLEGLKIIGKLSEIIKLKNN